MSITDYIPPLFWFVLFCVTHSLFASPKVKVRLSDKLPVIKPFYRLAYNILALILLVLFILNLPADTTLYKTSGLFFSLQIIIQISAAVSALLTMKGQGAEFSGLQQLSAYVRSGKMPGYLDESRRGRLQRSGFYQYMRHPLYTFSMIILITSPIMTANLAFITILAGIYFYTGSFFEERGLVKRFGIDYEQYRAEVPRFLPNISAIIKKQ